MNSELLNKIDLHVHFPSAAIPKDGPSAGVTIVTALMSLLSRRMVRSDVAMTGEITLKGSVLPVGGIKEKCLAAHTSGLRKILLPARNKKDLDDISIDTRKEIEFCFVNTIEDVLSLAIGESVINDDIFQRYDKPNLEKNIVHKQPKL